AHNQQYRQELLALLVQRSWTPGTVTLASGKTSDFYIDCKQTLLCARGAWITGILVHDYVKHLRHSGERIDALGGLTLGADPIAMAAATVSAATKEPVDAFIIRKEPKGHGTQSWLEGGKHLPAN